MFKDLIKKIFKKCDKVYFIGSTDKLPPPLSKEEEVKLVIRSNNGDAVAKDILIEHNLRLVVFIAKKYESTGYELEDLVSIGSIGLIKGINTYKLSRNIKLATYVSRCIANEILMFVRKNKKNKGDVSLEESLSFDVEGNELHLEDVLGTDDELVPKTFEHSLNEELMFHEINKLKKRDKEIMILRYGLNNEREYTQKEVAEKLGISQSYISRIEKKVIHNIQSLIE